VAQGTGPRGAKGIKKGANHKKVICPALKKSNVILGLIFLRII